MPQSIKQQYTVNANDFVAAGAVSAAVKKTLKQLGFPNEMIRRTSIAMYEGEINMVIHAEGGVIDVEIFDDRIIITLADKGPGIPDIESALKEGWSTATDAVREMGFGAGMGLPNIRKNTDGFELTSEIGVGTTLKITIETREEG